MIKQTLNKHTLLAIKRHDIDASHFQKVYTQLSGLSKKDIAFLQGRKLVLEELQSLLNTIPKGSRILDVGCGTAHLTNWIRQQGYEVHGIEPSTEMHAYARKNFPDIEIQQAISSNIPYPDNSFDLVVAFEVLRYLDKPENKKSLKEFHRVLSPGGSIFVTQVNLFSTDFYFIFHHLKHWYFKLIGKPHHYCHFTMPNRERKFALNAGFSKVKIIGRLKASIRLAYKFSVEVGNKYVSLIELFSGNQRKTGYGKVLSGHLIVMATK